MKLHALWVAGGLTLPFLATAGPSDYVYVPTVERGEREIDFKLGSARTGDQSRDAAASVGFGYGLKGWWFSEVYGKYKRENGEATHFDAYEWENKFQLTEAGQYPVDLGWLLEIERPQDHAEGWEVTTGPLLQTEFGKLQLNLNLLLQRNYRAAEAGDVQLKYQWQAKYRWTRAVEFGLQGFGEPGKWDRWSPREAQNHRAGPAIFGKLPLGGRQAIQYNAAWLLGLSHPAPDRLLRLQIEYEF